MYADTAHIRTIHCASLAIYLMFTSFLHPPYITLGMTASFLKLDFYMKLKIILMTKMTVKYTDYG